MRAALGLFVAALACIAVAWWVSMLPGTVDATIGGTTIGMSTPVAVALIAILFVALYLLIRLVAWVFRIPSLLGAVRAGRGRRTGEAAVNRALIALAANDAATARREAERGRKLLGDTPLTLLLAAQAGTQGGRDDEAAALYEQLAQRPDARLLGLRGLIRLAVEQQDWDRATALAADAEQAHPGTRWLRDERRFMAQQTGRWRDALDLSGPEHKAALAAAAAAAEPDPKAALSLAKDGFEAEPGLAPAAIQYADRLRQAGKGKAAQDVLRQAWSANPHPQIADAFVAGIDDKIARAREMAVLVRANPENAEAYLAIARAALGAGLLIEAKRQLQKAGAAGVNQRRYWSLLADLHFEEGNTDAAQEALRHLPDADADPVWRCAACGTQYDAWQPVCDTCRSTGTIRWTQPGDAAPTTFRLQQPKGVDGLTV